MKLTLYLLGGVALVGGLVLFFYERYRDQSAGADLAKKELADSQDFDAKIDAAKTPSPEQQVAAMTPPELTDALNKPPT